MYIVLVHWDNIYLQLPSTCVLLFGCYCKNYVTLLRLQNGGSIFTYQTSVVFIVFTPEECNQFCMLADCFSCFTVRAGLARGIYNVAERRGGGYETTINFMLVHFGHCC